MEQTKHVTETLFSNGYPLKFISHVKPRLLKKLTNVVPTSEELVGEFFNLVEPPTTRNGHAVLPYIKGLTDPLTEHCGNMT